VNGDLSIYALLSRLRFPKSYRGKIFCIAFVNMQVPMVAMVLYLWLSSPAGVGSACQHASAFKASLLSFSAVSRRAARSITSRNAVDGAYLPRVSNSQASASARPFSQPLFIKLPRMHLLRSWWAGAHRCVAMSRLMAMRLARS
jgi:hypothetical protein